MVDLNGHEAGNGGYSQGKPTAYRDSSTRRDGDLTSIDQCAPQPQEQSRIQICTACTRAVVFVPPAMLEKRDDSGKGMDTHLEGSTVDRPIGRWDPAQRQRRG